MAATSGGQKSTLTGYSDQLRKQLEQPDFINWLKVTLALGETGKGIKEFTDETFKQLQVSLALLCTTQPPCVNHCSETKTGKDGSTTNWCVVCESWKTELLKHHIPNNPKKSWIKYDSSKWPTDPAEIRKLFQRDGWLKANAGPTDPKHAADLSTLMFILTHCQDFISVISSKLIKKIRDVRNEYLGHNQAYTLSEAEKMKAFACMIEILELPNVNSCVGAADALDAVKQLEKMDPVDVLKRSGSTLQAQEIKSSIDILLKQVEQGDRLLEESLDRVEQKQDKTIQELKMGLTERLLTVFISSLLVCMMIALLVWLGAFKQVNYIGSYIKIDGSPNPADVGDFPDKVDTHQVENHLWTAMKIHQMVSSRHKKDDPAAQFQKDSPSKQPDSPQEPQKNPVSEFMEIAAKERLKPTFKFVDKGSGLGFIATAYLGDRAFPAAEGKNKQEAKMKAAEVALEHLKGHATPVKTPVSELMEYGQRVRKEVTFHSTKEGPDHQSRYRVSARLGNRQFPEVECFNKKEGNQIAARKALDILRMESAFEFSEKEVETKTTPLPSDVCMAPKTWEDVFIRIRQVVKRQVSNDCAWALKNSDGQTVCLSKNPVSLLQEYSQAKQFHINYQLVEQTGPANSPVFKMVAVLDERTFPDVTAVSKKEGKAKAAIVALEILWHEQKYTPD